MSATVKKTIEKTYKLDKDGERILGETIVETTDSDTPAPCGECVLDDGIELIEDDAASLFEIFLTVAAGTLFGSLIYNVIRKY